MKSTHCGGRYPAVVYREHTLGLLGDDGWIQPLRISALKGAPFHLHEAPFVPDMKDVRPATLADFDEFRVRYHPDYLIENQAA